MAFKQDGIQPGRAELPRLRSRAYAQAQRHSRRVRFLKRAIPLGAVLGIAAVTAFAVIDPFGRLQGLTLGPVSVSGSQVTMESPRLTGYRSKSGPYEVTASAATQDIRKPGLVELKDLKARLAMNERGGTARLEALTGLLDTQKEQLELRQNVRVHSDKGEEVRLKSASVDFRAGTVVSHEPVTVTFENGVIEATGIAVADGGRVMHFEGRVRATFTDVDSQAAPSPPSSQPARTSQAEPASVRR